ncbi:hypothetical protein GOV11_03470 [Candidatus Woesearchaeota archaeon]|nr:hypothetical protein [Candidatus Woesearchaeota archaeon]
MIGKGWYNESWRHSLSAKGVKTNSPHKYMQQAIDFSKASGSGAQKVSKPINPVVAPERQVDPIVELLGLGRSNDTRIQEEIRTGRLSQQRALDARAERSGLADVRRGILSVPQRTTRRDIVRGALEEEGSVSEKAAGVVRALRTISPVGAVDAIRNDLRSKGIPEDRIDAEVGAIRAELFKQAVQRAQVGQDIDGDVLKTLTSSQKKEVAAIQKERALDTAGAGSRFARELGRDAVMGVEETLTDLPGAVGGLLLEKVKDRPDIASIKAGEEKIKDIISLEDTNIFLGGDGGEFGQNGTAGSFNFFPSVISDEPTSAISSGIVPKEKFVGPDFGLDSGSPKSFGERIADQVEQLYDARDDLGKIDTKPLSKGKTAFDKGDREKLIEAINEQEFQVKQQESRWNLVDQVRNLVETNENRESKFNDKSKSPFSLGMFSNSGNKLADETKKITKVKEKVKDGADKARSRSSELRGMLRRMDSTIEPKTSLPEGEVKVFDQHQGFIDLPFTFRDAGSVVFGESKGAPQ